MDDREKHLARVRESIAAYCDAHHDFAFKANDPRVRLHEPTFGVDEIMAAVECLLDTRVTMGPKVKAFEREFVGAHGFAHAVMNNSGSSANLLAVAALANRQTRDGLRPGDEVIVPALSWSTTVWPLVQYGLVPVIVDIDPATLDIDPNEVERAIGPRTRGVMIVHVYGNPCDMDAIAGICRRRDLVLIEDACEALAARYDGRPVGGFGRVGTFSFYFSHHMTTLEGGICVTGDAELAEMMRLLRAHGWVRELENPEPYLRANPGIDPKFLFVNLGYNLRATELQGAMGSAQLPKLAGYVERRRRNAARLANRLAAFADVLAVQQETPKGTHSWFGLPVTVRDHAPVTTANLRRHLESNRIETRPIICGNVARQPAMALHEHRVSGDLRHADKVMRDAFSFGIHQDVDDAACDYVADRIAEALGGGR